ncbi:uncharacterized protein I206_101577 [Kwoniella pini CBS 10737]|uniref:Uncharacterized protein n=1 Tax=Kwoniella pini CBS 10737 TaxID=1296096 RepID=A0A1B9HWB1_9TREE|nr:uncharacterized protein I206_06453 [Kwoniella pini CBS 10737]OCF47551.1 hypothetical protein I206_06453 [Kwoniella pini CBS 10737]
MEAHPPLTAHAPEQPKPPTVYSFWNEFRHRDQGAKILNQAARLDDEPFKALQLKQDDWVKWFWIFLTEVDNRSSNTNSAADKIENYLRRRFIHDIPDLTDQQWPLYSLPDMLWAFSHASKIGHSMIDTEHWPKEEVQWITNVLYQCNDPPIAIDKPYDHFKTDTLYKLKRVLPHRTLPVIESTLHHHAAYLQILYDETAAYFENFSNGREVLSEHMREIRLEVENRGGVQGLAGTITLTQHTASGQTDAGLSIPSVHEFHENEREQQPGSNPYSPLDGRQHRSASPFDETEEPMDLDNAQPSFQHDQGDGLSQPGTPFLGFGLPASSGKTSRQSSSRPTSERSLATAFRPRPHLAIPFPDPPEPEDVQFLSDDGPDDYYQQPLVHREALSQPCGVDARQYSKVGPLRHDKHQRRHLKEMLPPHYSTENRLTISLVNQDKLDRHLYPPSKSVPQPLSPLFVEAFEPLKGGYNDTRSLIQELRARDRLLLCPGDDRHWQK